MKKDVKIILTAKFLVNIENMFKIQHDLKEVKHRIFAENLNSRVYYWFIGQTIFIMVLGIGQVLVLRSFFTDKKLYNSAPKFNQFR
jgi:hypothetical protein